MRGIFRRLTYFLFSLQNVLGAKFINRDDMVQEPFDLDDEHYKWVIITILMHRYILELLIVFNIQVSELMWFPYVKERWLIMSRERDESVYCIQRH